MNIPLLIAVAEETAKELTMNGIAPAQGRPVYNPHLRGLGLKLKAALAEPEVEKTSFPADKNLMRLDIIAFASEMNKVMCEKEGECKTPDNCFLALAQIQFQVSKFTDIIRLSPHDAQRRFIHIGNWAMVGHGIIAKNPTIISPIHQPEE